MDETLAQELLKDLRAAQAKLEAAQEDTASLKVLLALRTHQHDLAWQAVQRLEAERASSSGSKGPAAGRPAQADETAAAAAEALACSEERFAAAKTVLGAVLDCIGHRALDRRRFQELIAQAGRDAPDSGPGAARHAVLLAEARRVLGISE